MYFLMSSLFALVVPVWTLSPSPAITELAPSPPMGFNNWARFMCTLNQSVFTNVADAMAGNGLLAAGYNYINLDDCWLEKNRSSDGRLVWNSTLFPDGLVWLGEYLHDKGFKFGIYENAGNVTCGGYPGSKGYEEVDAQSFEDWGIDYVKIDGCNVLNASDPRSKEEQFRVLYERWHEVLEPRDIVYSESAPAYFSPNFQTPPHTNNSDWYEVMKWVTTYGQLARHSDDVKVYGIDGVYQPGGHWESILNNYGFQVLLARYQTCDFFNDPDFLIPFPDLTLEEKRSQFTLWASFSAPLIISAYIPELPSEDVEYLQNRAIIEVDQDELCEQATLVSQDTQFDILTKSLANGDRLLTVFNHGNRTASIRFPIRRLGLPNPEDLPYRFKDLWRDITFETIEDTFQTSDILPHETKIYRVSSDDEFEVTPTGQIFNTFSLECLTAVNTSGIRLQFQQCNGSDGQIWQTPEDGTIRPLATPHLCLTALSVARGLDFQPCGQSRGSQKWLYTLLGNLVVDAEYQTVTCLQEGVDGPHKSARLKPCVWAADSQTVALPAGVYVERAAEGLDRLIKPS